MDLNPVHQKPKTIDVTVWWNKAERINFFFFSSTEIFIPMQMRRKRERNTSGTTSRSRDRYGRWKGHGRRREEATGERSAGYGRRRLDEKGKRGKKREREREGADEMSSGNASLCFFFAPLATVILFCHSSTPILGNLFFFFPWMNLKLARLRLLRLFLGCASDVTVFTTSRTSPVDHVNPADDSRHPSGVLIVHLPCQF